MISCCYDYIATKRKIIDFSDPETKLGVEDAEEAVPRLTSFRVFRNYSPNSAFLGTSTSFDTELYV